MFKIGDFSKLSQVSAKTLRYYDELGLLKPVQVDRFTGYRFYSMEQLPRLNRILALKDLGLSLEQITQLLDKDLPAAELRGMLRMKQAELREHVQEELERLERVEARLRQIEQEDTMLTYDVVIKQVEPMLVASVRGIIPSYPEQGHLWEKLDEVICPPQNKVGRSGAFLTVYHSDEPEIDAQVCVPISSPVQPSGQVQVHELPAVETMACVVHHGPFITIGEAYKALLKWIEANGYRINGPCREVYLREAASSPTGPYAVSQTDPNTVTEIQFPVEKA